MNGLNYIGVLLLCIGVFLSLWTVRALVRRRALLRNPVKVNGVVIRVRHMAPSSSDSVGTSDPGKFYATIRFETAHHQTIERELPPTRDSSECQMGAVVRLVYQRGDPANVVYAEMRWADLVKSGIGSVIVLGIGALLCFCVDAR
jgi:Protein of unknown function (DUF3592)